MGVTTLISSAMQMVTSAINSQAAKLSAANALSQSSVNFEYNRELALDQAGVAAINNQQKVVYIGVAAVVLILLVVLIKK